MRTQLGWFACLSAAVMGLSAAPIASADPGPFEQVQPVFQDTVATPRWTGTYVDPSTNAIPPNSGGGCQQDGVFRDVIALTNSQLLGTTSWPSDNFRPAGTMPVTLKSISWSAGGSLNNNTANIELDDFTINIYDDVAGLPADVPRVSFPVSVGAGNLVKTLYFTFAPITGVTANFNDYTATVPDTVLPAGQCYWIEFIPTVLVGTTDRLWYIVSPASEGDGYRRFRARTGTFSVFSAGIDLLNIADMHFCVNFPLASTNAGDTCPVRSLMTCAGTAGSATQFHDGGGNISSSSRGTAFNADNFAVEQATTITGGCFYGNYNTAGTPPALTAESIQIRIYANSASGIPDTANVISTQIVSGAAANLTRTAMNAFAASFSYAFTLPTPVTVQPGCYWLEIQNQGTTPVWRLFLTQSVRAKTLNDGTRVFVSSAVAPPALPAYTVTGRVTNSDDVWSLNTSSGAILRSGTCPAQQNPTNTSCAAAASVPLTGVSVAGENFGPIPGPLPPNGPTTAFYTNPFGLWYSVVGDGNTVTVTTCTGGTIPNVAATTADTVVSIYCSTNDTTPCAGTLTWIAGNDQANPACGVSANASTVAFPTITGKTYLVYVQGFAANAPVAATGISRGYFYVAATTDGVAANPAAPSCSTLHTCQIEIPAGAVASSEPCGSPTETDNLCSNATVLSLDQWGTGTLFGYDNGQDVDTFKITGGSGLSGVFYRVTVRTELVVDLIVGGRGPCASDDFPGIVRVGASVPCTGLTEIDFMDTTGGDLFVSLQSGAESAPRCQAGGIGNRYAIRVGLAPVGVCCRTTATACEVMPSGKVSIMRLATDTAFNTCQAFTGTYMGDGTTCVDPFSTREPCDAGGGPPTGATTGSCCEGLTGTCFVSVNTGCAAASFTEGGTCAAGSCTSAAGRCCSDSGLCLITRPGECTGTSTFTTGITSCNPHACAAPGPTTEFCCRGTTCASVTAGTCTGTVGNSASLVIGICGPNNQLLHCCYADYDHSGTSTIDDLFIYINTWLVASPYTKINGNTVAQPSIDDLFIYINLWLLGCTP